MSSFETEIRGKAIEALAKIRSPLVRALADGVVLAAIHVEGEIKSAVRSMLKPGKGGLSRSWRPGKIEVGSGDVSIKVKSNLSYAGIQDHGGTVLPSKAKALTIPLSAEAKGKRARQFGDRLFVWKKGPKAYLAEQVGKKGKLVVHYRLKDSVKISGVDYLDAANRASAAGVSRIIGDAATSAVLEETK